MKAEIIAIGSELTSGAKLDTNSQWLSLELAEIGIAVQHHATMSDDRAAMLDVFQAAAQRSDIVLITGGLGPTLDDLTRELMAELAGVELVLDEPSLQFIEQMFAKRGRVMAERNRIQAMFPRGSEPLHNPIGTAPGVWLEMPRPGGEVCRLAAMPGVPSEMRRMYHEQVKPRLPQGTQVIRRSCVNCFGEGESNIEAMLGDLTARDRNPEVGITASSATITLRISSLATSGEEADRLISETKSLIREKLGTLIFGEDDDTLEAVLMRELAARGQTVASLEVGTQGLLSRLLSQTPESGQCFAGGLVLNNPAGLRRQAALPESDFSELISRTAVAAMARHCREQFASDFALAISPFSEPAAQDEIRVGFIALASADGVEIVEHSILNDLSIARPRASKTAINLLRRKLSISRDAPSGDECRV